MPRLKILAFDTATEACSVAIWIDGDVRERFDAEGRHSQRLLAMIEELRAQAGLRLPQFDAIAFGRGPGSFTGLRIGAAVAQGLGFAADIPVAPVSSLAALAQGVAASRVYVAIDARMRQIYGGAYVRGARGLMEPALEEFVAAPDQAPRPSGDNWVGAGSGWDVYADVLSARLGTQLSSWEPRAYPRARHVAELGAGVCAAGRALPAERALPVYLRDDVAVKPTPP